MSDPANQRLQQLDLLRCIAVLLVLGRHMKPCPPETNIFLHYVSEVWIRGGWVGVDLFFVLSGFLVSGLIFREYKRKGTSDIKRFLIRRGFKIYPAFWVLLAITLAVVVVRKLPIDMWGLAGEVLFLQNYFGSLWGHTWSLAVEEHFYILLAILFYFLGRNIKENTFAAVPKIFVGLAIVCFALRWYVTATTPYSFLTHLVPTHLRIDSLFFGVLISYYWNFKDLGESEFLQRNRIWLGLLGVALFAPAFIFPLETTPWITPIGLTMFYLGGGCLLLSFLKSDFSALKFLRPLSYIGVFSYSIYLWHMAVETWGITAMKRFLPLDNWFVYVAVYFAGAIIFGIFMAKIIEYPFLKLRDKLYPSKAAPMKDASEAEMSDQTVKP